MAEAILDLRLDTVQPNRVRLVYGVQNDYNSRYICARFTANGKPIDIEKTAAVRINAKRPDGNKDAFPGTVNTDGTAKVPVAQWMLDVPGEVSASITAVTTNGALTTQEFYIMAKASIWDSTDEPSAENPDKDVLQTIIASENERVAAESARVANENARKSAETARATAETKRIADEATRVANEAERVSAESVRKAEFATWSEEVGKISAFDKRLENLEAAVSPEIVTPTTDSTVAYQKTVPANVLPNAAVCEVGGMSYKCENLIPFPYLEGAKTQYGITWTVNADQSITASGTAELDSSFRLAQIDFGESNVNFTRVPILENGYTFVDCGYTPGTKTVFLWVTKGSTINTTFYPMINKGEAKPYQPYFTGLRDSKVTALESVGANLFDINSLIPRTYIDIDSGNLVEESVDGWYCTSPLKVKDNVTISGIVNTGDGAVRYRTLNASGNVVSVADIGLFTAKTITLTIDEKFFQICIRSNNLETININHGTAALPYSRGFRNTLAIPKAVQNMGGYGQGVNAQCYNKIVLDPAEGVKKYVRKSYKSIGINGADGGRQDSGFANTYYIGVNVAFSGKNNLKAILSDRYSINTVAEIGKKDGVCVSTGEHIYITDSRFADETTTKAILAENPLYFLGGFDEAEETDVSAYFTDDNRLPVEAGGTITAVNEYEHAVPFTVKYMIKGA